MQRNQGLLKIKAQPIEFWEFLKAQLKCEFICFPEHTLYNKLEICMFKGFKTLTLIKYLNTINGTRN